MNEKLFIKNNAINTKVRSTGRLISKKQYDLDKENLEQKEDIDKEISNTSNLVTNAKPIQNVQRFKIYYLILL